MSSLRSSLIQAPRLLSFLVPDARWRQGQSLVGAGRRYEAFMVTDIRKSGCPGNCTAVDGNEESPRRPPSWRLTAKK